MKWEEVLHVVGQLCYHPKENFHFNIWCTLLKYSSFHHRQSCWVRALSFRTDLKNVKAFRQLLAPEKHGLYISATIFQEVFTYRTLKMLIEFKHITYCFWTTATEKLLDESEVA